MKYIHVSPAVHKAVNNAHKVEYKRNDIYKDKKREFILSINKEYLVLGYNELNVHTVLIKEN